MSSAEDRHAAQARADRIAAFREELAAAEGAGVLRLDEAERRALAEYHGRVLEGLAARFDIDTSRRQKSVSWGMRIAATLGGGAFCAAAWFVLMQFWGFLGSVPQVALLVAGPLLATLALEQAARRERSPYFTVLFALLAVALFAIDLAVLGRTFNIAPSPLGWAAVAAFALLLGHGYGLRLPVVAGLLAAFVAGTGLLLMAGGYEWTHTWRRPELFLPPAALVLALGVVERPLADPRQRLVYRVVGLVVAAVVLLMLGSWGGSSLLPLEAATVEIVYQLAGFAAAVAMIVLGLRAGLGDVVDVGVGFFGVLLVQKFFDWFWESLPKSVFFLAVGVFAVLALVLLARVRRRMAAGEGA